MTFMYKSVNDGAQFDDVPLGDVSSEFGGNENHRLDQVGRSKLDDSLASPTVPEPISQASGYEFAKRSFDITFALVMIALTLPVMGLIILATKMTSPGPVLFQQERVGYRGQIFRCLKFRTMVVDAAERLEHLLANDPAARDEWHKDQKLRCDPRITPIGVFLRTSSLDELPQLFNILLGSMSVVGPRPIVPSETHRYGDQILFYQSVRPGLTGLWQVSGRNETGYEERVRLDCSYAQNPTFARDLTICFRTIPAVLASRGSY